MTEQLQEVTDRRPYTAYQLQCGENEGKWGFFLDDECTRFYQPFDTSSQAQQEADRFKESNLKPARFTAAWRDAILWLNKNTGFDVDLLINGDINAETYEEMTPRLSAFADLARESSGVRAFALQAYSFYNTSDAVNLSAGPLEGLDENEASAARHGLQSLAPIMLGSTIDNEGSEILIRLMRNYCGW